MGLAVGKMNRLIRLCGAAATLALVLAARTTLASSYAYILNDSTNTISVIDTATNTIVATPDVGGTSFNGSAVLPNGNFAYIGVSGTSQVAVIDTVTQTQVATITGFSQPGALAALPDSSRVYVANQSTRRIDVIDTATNTITTAITLPVGTAGVALAASPDGSRVYLVLSSGGYVLRYIDTATNTLNAASVSAGSFASGLTVSPDGATVYVAASGDGEIRVVNAAAMTLSRTITAANSPSAVAVSPDGATLYVPAFGGNALRVIDAASGSSIANITTAAQPVGVSLNPAGTRAYVTSLGGNTVSVVDTASNTVLTTLGAPRPSGIGKFVTPELSRLTVSPDGTTVTAKTAAGPVLTCSGSTSCQRNYATTATVTLTATSADPARPVTGWGGDCTGTTATITVTMTGPRNCTPSFYTPPPAPTPPAPPPAWLNPAGLPPAVTARVDSLGAFRVSVAPFFTTTLASLAATVPDFLQPLFTVVTDAPSKLLSGIFKMPPASPVQPIVAPDTDRATGTTTLNPIYPPGVTVTTPLTVTGIDTQGTGASLAMTLTVQGPRLPAAMAALSVPADGQAVANGAAARPALSHDGGQVVFQSAATNLVPTAIPTGTDVLRYRALSGTLDRLSQTAAPGGGASAAALGPAIDPAVAGDGTYAAFTASGPGLVAGLDTHGVRQIYRIGLKYPRIDLNPATPVAELVSGTMAGLAGDGHADSPALSRDGRHVAFTSRAANFTAGLDANARIWRKDMATGALMLVSANPDGTPLAVAAADPAITADGRFVAFAADGRVYLKDLGNGGLWNVAAGSRPRVSANGDTIVFVAGGSVVAVRGTTTTTIGTGDQPSVSADGRFVAWRTPEGQIQVGDIMRGATALVSRTATGQPGNAASSDPALSGDGRSIAFATQARDLVNGNPAAAQLMLAGNPLVDPAGTRYWYVTTGDQQSLAIERHGDRAYVASLTYDTAGNATWNAGFCRFAGLTCSGQFSHVTGGASIADARAAAVPAAAFAIAFAETGTDATLTLNQRTLGLHAFPLGGSTYATMPGLPEAGWWYDTDDPSGATGWFLATATPVADGAAGAPVAMLTGTVYDQAGQPFWAVAQGAITGTTTFAFGGTLNRYAGGAPLGLTATQSPSGNAVGPIAITWTGPRTATAVMPNGQRTNLARWVF